MKITIISIKFMATSPFNSICEEILLPNKENRVRPHAAKLPMILYHNLNYKSRINLTIEPICKICNIRANKKIPLDKRSKTWYNVSVRGKTHRMRYGSPVWSTNYESKITS